MDKKVETGAVLSLGGRGGRVAETLALKFLPASVCWEQGSLRNPEHVKAKLRSRPYPRRKTTMPLIEFCSGFKEGLSLGLWLMLRHLPCIDSMATT